MQCQSELGNKQMPYLVEVKQGGNLRKQTEKSEKNCEKKFRGIASGPGVAGGCPLPPLALLAGCRNAGRGRGIQAARQKKTPAGWPGLRVCSLRVRARTNLRCSLSSALLAAFGFRRFRRQVLRHSLRYTRKRCFRTCGR